MPRLSETIERKFTESIELDDWQVWSHDGWHDISHSNKTIPYRVYEIFLENGLIVQCADDHVLISESNEEVFAKDSLGWIIDTELGPSRVISINDLGHDEEMYDLSVDGDHTYYSNGILSHNTTTMASLILHDILFVEHSNWAVLAHKASQAAETLDRVKGTFESLPRFLKQGIVTWNKGNIELANGSKVLSAATSSGSVRGKSFTGVYLDEFAFVPENLAEEFFTSTFPTISSGQSTKLWITSTPKGLNKFYKMWDDAVNGRSEFAWVDCKWDEVPGRDEEWKKKQIAIIGLDKWQQEFEAQFLGSSGTLIYGDVLRRLTFTNPKESSPDGYFKVYEEPAPGHIYTINVDVGGGKGLDHSAFIVTDCTSLPYKVVATFRSNMIEPFTYANYIYPVAKRYNDAWVLIEVNSIGAEVANNLYYGMEYENLLYTSANGRGGQKIATSINQKTNLGIMMSTRTKSIGCSNIKQLIENDQFILNDEELYNEFTKFSKKGNSYEAEEGSHDDLAMCAVSFGWLAAQEYFKEITDTDLVKKIIAQRAQDIESETMLFMIHDDGMPQFSSSDNVHDIGSADIDEWLSRA